MRPALAYGAIFVFTIALVTFALQRSKPSSTMPTSDLAAAGARKANVLLKAYLAILILFELVALYRLHVLQQPFHHVIDFFTQPKDSAFVALFTTFLCLLVAARLAALLAPPLQPQAWLACALTHIVEALYLIPLALREGAIPATLSAFRPATHGARSVIVLFVAFSAYLFTCTALLAHCAVPSKALGKAHSK